MAIQIFWELTKKYKILAGNLINLIFWMAGGIPVTEFRIIVGFTCHNFMPLLSFFLCSPYLGIS